MSRLICWVTRHHSWRPAGYHYRACVRCPRIEVISR